MQSGKGPVIIIGGGVAGLSAARMLSRRGMKVILLEAKPRFGGRIYTIHQHGIPVELGAEFIHGRSRPLLRAISDAGLTAQKTSARHLEWVDGGFKESRLWDRIGAVIDKIDLRSPDVSFSTFLSGSRFPASTRQLATNYVQGFDAADPDRISAHSLLQAERSAERMGGSWQGRLREGYSALVEFLAADAVAHGAILVEESPVREIVWKNGAVEVRALSRGRRAVYRGAAAILTLPLGVWKSGRIRLRPSVPQKIEAIAQLEFGQVVKCVLTFREKWWPAPAGTFIHAPGEPFFTWWHDPRGPMLIAWMGGPAADALRNHSPGRLKTICVGTLAKIFAARPSFVRRELSGFHHHDWAKDPDILGAYSYIPVNGMELPGLLAAPVGKTLFFAGEATVRDAQMGTVFGALESGERAAREVLGTF